LGHLNLASLKCAFLPRASGTQVQTNGFFFRQHYRITLAASLEKIYSRILGRVMTIH